MAQFDESKIINALHPEKAEVGKKYWYSDSLILLRKYVENNDVNFVGELECFDNDDDACGFRINSKWEFLYPYEEPPKKRMTKIQLMEWLMKGNGILKFENGSGNCYTNEACVEKELNNEVGEDVCIRTWDSEEWIEPTVDIYERDCCGMNIVEN